MKILKIILIISLIASVSSGVYIYINRASIFDRTVNKLIKNIIPAFIEVGGIEFDFDKARVIVKEFKILNPPGYTRQYLLEIPLIKCFYEQKDAEDILGGLRVRDIDLINPSFYIERRKDSRFNVQEMGKVFKNPKKVKQLTLQSRILGFFAYTLSPVKKIEEFLEIDPVFNVKNGSFIFDDRYIREEGYMTTIKQINSKIELDIKADLKGIDYIRSDGSGFVNGEESQAVDWVVKYDPTMPKLTMANTFRIKDLDFTHFQPYYDKFSPFIFKRGRASGDLVFNFDNGEIGSVNEVRLSYLQLEIKEDFPNRDFWAANIEDLYKYFVSASGEAVFDFKIKGPMENPEFHLGSKTKRALTKLVVSKIVNIIFETDNSAEGTQTPGQSQGGKSDIEKIIDIFKSF